MKKLHFDDLGKQKYWIVFLLLSLVLVLSGSFTPYEFENPKVYRYFSVVVCLIQILFYSRLFWYKNNVQWNKKGIVIRIKPYFGKLIRFDEIKSVEFNDNSLTIKKQDGTKVFIDLPEINPSDKEKLLHLLQENSAI
jgi:hypothetical protein